MARFLKLSSVERQFLLNSLLEIEKQEKSTATVSKATESQIHASSKTSEDINPLKLNFDLRATTSTPSATETDLSAAALPQEKTGISAGDNHTADAALENELLCNFVEKSKSEGAYVSTAQESLARKDIDKPNSDTTPSWLLDHVDIHSFLATTDKIVLFSPTVIFIS